ncbi:MAG: rhodanese-like domain-containing protein [Clostridioides sp.]|jgi:rhodanese-related sulfurtransferase|nr:rhodanese-like domain-containing protein [Clostridioides sp.]
MFYQKIDYDELKSMMKQKDVLLLDVRQTEDYDDKHFDGFINIPIQYLLANLHKIVEYKDKKIIIVCVHGKQSDVACQLLYIHGYKNLYELDGGVEEILYGESVEEF